MVHLLHGIHFPQKLPNGLIVYSVTLITVLISFFHKKRNIETTNFQQGLKATVASSYSGLKFGKENSDPAIGASIFIIYVSFGKLF